MSTYSYQSGWWNFPKNWPTRFQTSFAGLTGNSLGLRIRMQTRRTGERWWPCEYVRQLISSTDQKLFLQQQGGGGGKSGFDKLRPIANSTRLHPEGRDVVKSHRKPGSYFVRNGKNLQFPRRNGEPRITFENFLFPTKEDSICKCSGIVLNIPIALSANKMRLTAGRKPPRTDFGGSPVK